MRILLLCWVLLVPIWFLSLGVASGQCRGDQRSLLLQLKNSLEVKVNVSKKLGRWNQSSDCCSWEGVNCTEGLVTGLNLSGESISGGLEDSGLFGLENLTSLDLSFNHFGNSEVPGMIGNLTSLVNLNLSNAGFGGQIPEAVSKLTGLVTLDLSVSPLYEISSLKLHNPSLRTLIQNLTKLEELYLDGINISSSGSEWGQALSSSVPNLQVLSLANCYLSGPIDQSLEKLKFLSVIRLDNNNLSSPVPRFLSGFSKLKSLSLISCGLTGGVPKEIFQVSTLEILDMAYNQLLQGSFPEFPQSHSLRRVILRSTNFTESLPSSFGNLRNLSILDLLGCQFKGPLPVSIEELRRLVSVDLSFNQFSGPIPSFKMAKNLTQLVLSHNSFSGAIASANWEGLDKLVLLDLRNNLLEGSIPSSLFTLPSLEQLQLSNNQFEGQLPEIQDASSSVLETLDLSSNDLNGSLPMSIFNLKSLTILSLSSNRLKGTVQLGEIQGLHNLTSLDLSNNNLSVVVGDDSPSSSFAKLRTLKLASCDLRKFPNLKNLPSVVTLDLSNNKINGEIPNWIWDTGNGTLFHLNLSCNNLVSLREPYSPGSFLNYLDLHSNNITGRIPLLPPSASYIDLSRNKFSSSIPVNIGTNLSQAIFFSLSNNNLTGNLPESICTTSSILVLDFSSNNLSGPIPDCVPAMSKTLTVLNLQRNSFSGTIPDSFPSDCHLQTLDLNGNSIREKVPKSLANCTELEVLNLGNNDMQDEFPRMLKNISALRVLVLRSNKFHGKISCPNKNDTWPNLQILDISHNDFSGKIPGACISRYAAMHKDVPVINHIQFNILKFSNKYYQDSVTITIKGLELEFEKILTLFTSMDLSCNHFDGGIPENIGQLRALYVLNLSHNGLTGPIPPSIGNLTQLESLDLSHNMLNGSIPESLAGLNFLSFLDLSYNQLVGLIPRGSQFQTFPNNSFLGNKALCGFPLSAICNSSDERTDNPDAEPSLFSDVEVDWQSIYSGIGFGVGAGAIVALLNLWRDGRYWLEDNVDEFLLKIIPMMGYSYKPRDEWEEEDDDLCLEEEQDGTELEDIQSQGLFCVFCSKLDVTRRRVIHDIRCTCHSSPDISSSSFYSSSSSSSLR